MSAREFTGKTTQEAIDNGLSQLGVTIADVRVEVLQEGAKGLFGLFGAKPARVRLTLASEEKGEDDGLSDLLGSFSLDTDKKPKAQKKPAPEKKAKPEPEQKPQKTEKPKAEAPKAEKPKAEEPKPEVKPEAKKEKAKAEEKPEQKPEEKQEAPQKAEKAPRKEQKKQRPPRQKQEKPRQEEPEEEERKEIVPFEPEYVKPETFAPEEPPVLYPQDTPAGMAQMFVMDVTERMGVKVDVYVTEDTEESVSLHMLGDTLGILIGRRGDTLDALQYLTSLKVNRGREEYIRVTLDSENYRSRREDSLRRLAYRMANRAQKTGRRVTLEPMNPYERRILHTALQAHPAVTTHSEGEEPNRRVVITLKTSQKAQESGEEGGKGRKRSRHRGGRGKGQRRAQLQTVELETLESEELENAAAMPQGNGEAAPEQVFSAEETAPAAQQDTPTTEGGEE